MNELYRLMGSRIVRVLFASVRELMLHQFHREEVDKDTCDDALPKGLGEEVPHLGVDAMHFLHFLDLAGGWRRVSDYPCPQIVHMREQRPAVLEGHLLAWLQELILVLGWADVI